MTNEPLTEAEEPGTQWHEWMCALGTEDLKTLTGQLGAWCPADNPTLDPDVQMMKWELACQELARR